MQKPRGFIWREPDKYFGLGRIHFGRVSMSIAMVIALWNIPAGLMFLGGGIAVSSQYRTGQDYGAASVVASIGGYMLLLTVLVLIIWGLVSLVKWIAKDIRVDGPGR